MSPTALRPSYDGRAAIRRPMYYPGDQNMSATIYDQRRPWLHIGLRPTKDNKYPLFVQHQLLALSFLQNQFLTPPPFFFDVPVPKTHLFRLVPVPKIPLFLVVPVPKTPFLGCARA